MSKEYVCVCVSWLWITEICEIQFFVVSWCIRLNNSFNFSLGWIKCIVIAIVLLLSVASGGSAWKKRVSVVVVSMTSMGRTFQSVIVLGRDEWGSSLSYGCGCAHRFLVNLVQCGCSWDLSALLHRSPPGSVLSILDENRFVSEFTRGLPLAITLRRSLGLCTTTFRGPWLYTMPFVLSTTQLWFDTHQIQLVPEGQLIHTRSNLFCQTADTYPISLIHIYWQYVRVGHDLELLRYVLRCAIKQQL